MHRTPSRSCEISKRSPLSNATIIIHKQIDVVCKLCHISHLHGDSNINQSSDDDDVKYKKKMMMTTMMFFLAELY